MVSQGLLPSLRARVGVMAWIPQSPCSLSTYMHPPCAPQGKVTQNGIVMRLKGFKIVLHKRKHRLDFSPPAPFPGSLPPEVPTPSSFSLVPELPFRGLGTRPVGNNGQWNWSCQLQHQLRLPPPRPLNCLPPPAWEPPHTTTLTTPSHPRNINAPFIPTWQGLLERRGQEGGGDPE